MKKINHIFLMLTCLMLLGSCSKKMETVTVHTAEELIKALKSDTHIIIDADGDLDINLAVFNGDLPVVDMKSTQKGVVKFFDNDDITLRIRLDNVIIEGADPNNKVHFLSNESSADVLYLEGCNNVTIKNIKAGHLLPGDCMGDVIDVENCNNITIDNCELYGCGVTGVSANSSKNIAITNCWIYECSQDGIWLNDVENATISNSKIEFCRNASFIEENCKNVVFTDCTTENNNEQSYEMNVVAKMMKMSGDQPFEGPDPEDLEDSEEPEYLTDCYTGEVEYSEPEGAQIKGSELETVTVHNVDEFKNAIGSNKKIVIESSEKLSCSDEIEFIGLINMVIDGKNAVTDFKFMFTSGCSDIIIQDITLESIHIGAGCNGFDILRCKTPVEGGGADYCLRIFDAENIFVNSCEIWYSPTIINKSTDIEFVGCDFNQCNRYMEANDISNVWFNACTFENSPGDGESDEYGHFKLDSPVVFLKCRLKVWQAYADFSMAKLIECPKCFADMEDWSDLYE